MSTQEADRFEVEVAPHRAELRAFCYRMLGSLHDADDAVQDTLVRAWRGLGDFAGRGSLRGWLYRIATNVCLRALERRRARLLPADYGAAASGVDVEAVVEGPLWLEPYPSSAIERHETRESLELAFVAALQHLPGNQRAALILRDVLGFSADETAELLATSVAAVNSALQRARQTVERRVPAPSQQATRRSLGSAAERALVERYLAAWGQGDVDALVRLLADDARFTMPPIPTWFLGRAAIARFLGERVFATAWRLEPTEANGQLAFVCYQGPAFQVGALNVVTLRGPLVAEMTGFLDPAVHAYFRQPGR